MNGNSNKPTNGNFLDDDGDSINVVEELTRSLKTTESDHTSNHLGYGFRTSMAITNLAAGQSLSWCFKGPSTLYAHLKNISLIALGSSAKLELLKGADVTVNTGTLIPLRNTNDNSARVAQSSVRANPTYTGGTVWDDLYAFVDSTAVTVGSASLSYSLYEESITKSGDEEYIIKLTNIGSDPLQNAWIRMLFYEEPNGIIA